VGRASNRKKAQRQTGPDSRKARQGFQARAATQEQFPGGLGELVQLARSRVEREADALPAWRGDAEPVSAEAPPWPENSLGDRLLQGTYLGEAQDAPCLLTARIPDAAVIAADPAHWNIAMSALVRAVVFDGLTLDHPAVSMLLGVLAPIAETELAYARAEASPYSTGADWDDDVPEFPTLDGPVYLLGERTLVDTVWAAVGDDPLGEVIKVLVQALDGAVPGLDARVAADALIGAFADNYQCERPEDLEELERIGYPGGNPLENLVDVGAVAPAGILPAGLTILPALARLCLSDSVSILDRTA
jgi:hypothetical protein